ncbi:MAG: glycosyltransferase [Smithella sp.]|nr:glycosyltransferase [Smithella sp.]
MIDQKPSITIALTRYQEPDDLLHSALRGIANQEKVRAAVHFLDQSHNRVTENFCRQISSSNITFLYKVIPARGCAYARNAAIKLCETDILLWTDPDIFLPPDWAHHFFCILGDHSCDVIGGKIIPQWQKTPRWYMKTGIMMDQYSVLDLGDDMVETSRIIGGSMGLNIKKLGKQAFFDENLGRQKGTLLGGVDSEFCERVIQQGFSVCYIGTVIAGHYIPASKMRPEWIARKFFYSGLSRSLRGGKPSVINKQSKTFSDYFVLAALAVFYSAGFIAGIMRQKK